MTETGPKLRRSDLNQIQIFAPRLQELGHIKIGIRGAMRKSAKGNEFQPPQKLDHFVITTMQRGPDGNLLEDPDFAGKKPTEIEVLLPFDDPNLNFQSFFAAYTAHKCHCKGNGKEAMRLNEQTEIFDEIICDPETCDWYKEKKCKPNGILSLILKAKPLIGGVYKFRTTSYNTIKNIRSTLSQIIHFAGRGMSGITFKLVIRPEKVTPASGNQAGKETLIYTVNLTYAGTMVELAEHARAMLASRIGVDQLPALESAERKALEAEPITDETHAPDVAMEYYPEVVQGEMQGPPKPPMAPNIKPISENICYSCGVILPSNFVRGTCECGAALDFGKQEKGLF